MTTRMPAVLALLSTLPLLTAAGAGASSSDPVIDAGGVATIVVQTPAPEGLDSAGYRIRLDPGFRSFIPERGRVGRLDDVFLVAATFATPRGLLAGEHHAGTLTLEVEGAEPVVHPLTVRILERRQMEFVVTTEEVVIAPDAVGEVRYTLRNRGNTEDTVHVAVGQTGPWSFGTVAPAVVAPGQEQHGALRVVAPTSADPGKREMFLITARTEHDEQTRVFHAVVVSTPGWLGGLAHVPSRVFVGHSLEDGAGPVVTLTGAGRIGPDTELRYDFRHSEPGFMDPSLQRQLGGPRLRAEIRRPDLRLAVGDVNGYRTTISSSLRPARGVRLEYDPEGPLSTRFLAAGPLDFSGRMSGGHLAHIEAGLETDVGTFSILAGDLLDPSQGTLPSFRSTGAGLRWNASSGPHTGSIEATGVRLSAGDSLTRSGAAIDANYILRARPLSGRLRLRTVPGGATTAGGHGNELSGSFSAELRPGMHLVGWGHRTDQHMLSRDSHDRSAAGSVGVRHRTGPLQLHVSATANERDLDRNGSSASLSRRTIRSDATYSRGPWSLHSDAEVGTGSELGVQGDYRAFGAAVRWHQAGNWAWLRVQQTARPGSLPSAVAIQTGGAFDLGPVGLAGGATATTIAGTTTTSFWSSAEVEVQRNMSLHLGASARPAGGSNDWSFSIGASRRLAMPLPVARQPDIRGVVFEDLNNNGRRDPGEPAIEGVAIAAGHLRVRTDEAGRFAFRDAPGAPVTVATRDLPVGFMVAPGTALRRRGFVEVPLVRTASLELHLFLDRNEDGEWDAGEEAGAGVQVTLTDELGRPRTVTAGRDGLVRITGIVPGRYSITARPPGEREVTGRDPVVLMELEIKPGAAVQHTLAVPLRSRTIRMGPGSEGFEFFR